jgi:hypothetical protein
MTHYLRRGDGEKNGWLMGAIKHNPEGLLLLAAGAALLLRSAGPSRASESFRRSEEFGRADGSQDWKPRARAGGNEWNVGERLSEAAEGAREYASDIAEKVSETASSYASSVSSYADEALGAASEHSRRITRQAQSTVQDTVDYVLQEQPLAVALVGLAAGAAVAAAFPATKVEKRTLGPAGERVRDAAVTTGEQLKEATVKAGERLMSAADERGLNSDGLTEVARDVGDSFSSALSGEESQTKSQSSGGSSPVQKVQSSGTSRSDQSQGSRGAGSAQSSGQPSKEGAPSIKRGSGSSESHPRDPSGKRGRR